MPYNDDGAYLYETEVPAAGDQIRQSFMRLLHDCESYLFNTTHPGYAKPEYLSWAMARAQAQYVSSGNPTDEQLYWNPSIASEDEVALSHTDEKFWGGASAVSYGIRYPRAAFQAEGVDTNDQQGEAELYNVGPRVVEVATAADASAVNKEAVVVGPRSHQAADKADGE